MKFKIEIKESKNTLKLKKIESIDVVRIKPKRTYTTLYKGNYSLNAGALDRVIDLISNEGYYLIEKVDGNKKLLLLSPESVSKIKNLSHILNSTDASDHRFDILGKEYRKTIVRSNIFNSATNITLVRTDQTAIDILSIEGESEESDPVTPYRISAEAKASLLGKSENFVYFSGIRNGANKEVWKANAKDAVFGYYQNQDGTINIRIACANQELIGHTKHVIFEQQQGPGSPCEIIHPNLKFSKLPEEYFETKAYRKSKVSIDDLMVVK